MQDGGTILALDVATVFGSVCEAPGGMPRARSGKWGLEGAKDPAIFAAALTWAATEACAFGRPAVVFMEKPGLHSVAKGKSAASVIYRLWGLCAALSGTLSLLGVNDIRLVDAGTVRAHFIGDGALPGEDAKALVQQRCTELGWPWRTPDEADALAIWAYGCEQVRPGSGHAAPAGYAAEARARAKAARAEKKLRQAARNEGFAFPERMTAKEAAALLFKPKGATRNKTRGRA